MESVRTEYWAFIIIYFVIDGKSTMKRNFKAKNNLHYRLTGVNRHINHITKTAGVRYVLQHYNVQTTQIISLMSDILKLFKEYEPVSDRISPSRLYV
jgi:hypothetical protein